MATYADIGVSQPAASTITMKVGTVVLTRNSTAQHQEILCVGDPETTNALARITSSNADSTMWGIVTRPAPAVLQTAASTQGTGSTRSTIVSSNAATYARITGYSVMSTLAGVSPVRGGFYSGATLLWPVCVWPDGGVVKDQMAVAYPGYLFAGSTGVPITWNQDSTGDVTVAITYFTGA